MTIDCKPLFKPGAVVLASALMLVACGGGEGKPAASAAGAAVPVVTVTTVHPEPVARVTELPGRTVPWMIADIRPQVTGIIKRREFNEGSMVEAGQLLYQIDPATYRAAFDAAKAVLARAEANLGAARLRASCHS